ncbi:MAG TPA: GNAT family protein [Planctomycetota bacterium]|nr:GNAT family protein [Planctomycetota bacterium]
MTPSSTPPLPPFTPRPVTLDGRFVRLEPLAESMAEPLFHAGRDPDIWKYLPRAPLTSVDDTRAWIVEALKLVPSGSQIPFAIVPKIPGLDGSPPNQPGGSSRYIDIRAADRGLEIGWTWVGTPWQRTAVNTEAKLLLMRHAFETLGAIRVQLKTDLRNVRSQNAIERIGAKREGILRKHVILWDGYIRDTVMFSVTREEWPEVQRRLEAKLSQPHR